MRWIPAISGAISTAAAVVVLAFVPQGQVTEQVPEPLVAQTGPEGFEIGESDPVEATTPTRALLVAPEVTPDVPELGSTLADVLADGGFTEFVGATELSRTLPESVVDVLIAEGSVD